MESIKFKTINEYYTTLPPEVKAKAKEIHKIIKSIIPQATEVISYNMPAFKMQSVLVYYAGYKGHIGFYPTSSGIANFKDEFKDYKWSKGAVQFPLDKPLPVKLIEKIVRHRLKEDLEKLKGKKK